MLNASEDMLFKTNPGRILMLSQSVALVQAQLQGHMREYTRATAIKGTMISSA